MTISKFRNSLKKKLVESPTAKFVDEYGDTTEFEYDIDQSAVKLLQKVQTILSPLCKKAEVGPGYYEKNFNSEAANIACHIFDGINRLFAAFDLPESTDGTEINTYSDYM